MIGTSGVMARWPIACGRTELEMRQEKAFGLIHPPTQQTEARKDAGNIAARRGEAH